MGRRRPWQACASPSACNTYPHLHPHLHSADAPGRCNRQMHMRKRNTVNVYAYKAEAEARPTVRRALDVRARSVRQNCNARLAERTSECKAAHLPTFTLWPFALLPFGPLPFCTVQAGIIIAFTRPARVSCRRTARATRPRRRATAADGAQTGRTGR